MGDGKTYTIIVGKYRRGDESVYTDIDEGIILKWLIVK
jgi:hypothetical protein